MQRSRAIPLIFLSSFFAVACAAAPQGFPPEPAPTVPGHVNVNVVCGDSGHATVLAIAPWRVVPDRQRAVAWHANGPKELKSFEVRAADTKHWPFPQTSYDSHGSGEIVATLSPVVQRDTYHYVLRIVCPQKVITIDPDIMVRH
ncbi:MAG: hypothetical protein P8099_02975 [Gemmatimonadota bacterium]|jgi:hypothetical protein